MQKSPYSVLGLKDDATQEQIDNAYYNLKQQYEAKLFEEGEVGMEASKKLAELERAYSDCIEDLNKRVSYDNYGGTYGMVEDLIRQGKINEAQKQLDAIEPRDAEWHYMQAVIYYKRNWHIESKKQLELAVALDPGNAKYQNTLNKLTESINNSNAQQQSAQGRGGYARPDAQAAGNAATASACCNTCSTLICCDCLCECCGGDLIPCC
ncbi:MAG TPA: hypothetical protein H9677_03285 [Firmicutes bacterium]|nr:hypothetical protein [Bacillota bacterium]